MDTGRFPLVPSNRRPLPVQLQMQVFDRHALRQAHISGDRLRAADILQVTHGAHRALTMPLTGWETLGYQTPPVSRPPEEVAVVVKRARAVASHQTALRLHGFILPPWLQDDDGLIHVSRPHVRGVASRRGVVTHGRTVPAEDVEVMHGIPVTSIERTWADLAALLPMGMVDELVVAGDGIVKRPWTPDGRREPLTTVERLRAAVSRAGRYKGVRTARAALDLIRVGSDAATETKMRLALIHAGLPEPELQLILDPSRPVSPDGDMGYRQWRLVLHYDGAPHDDEAQKLVDAWRNKGWDDAGWAQIWATVEDYRDDFRRVIHEVRCRRDEVEGQG